MTMGEHIERIVIALARGENAQSLVELAESTGLSIDEVAQGIDLLVALRIFCSDASYHASEVGDMVYMFADNDNAQQVFKSVL